MNDTDIIKDFLPDSRLRELLNRMKVGETVGFTNRRRHYTIKRDE